MTAPVTTAAEIPDSPAILGANWPTFIREFDGTLAVHAQYVLYGNIRDMFVMPAARPLLLSLPALLWEVLRVNGFHGLIVYDTIDGVVTHPLRGPGAEDARNAATLALGGAETLAALNKATAQASGGAETTKAVRDRLSQLRHAIEAVTASAQHRVAFVIDYASHLTRNPGDPGPDERAFFLACAKLSASARPQPGPPGRQPLYNPVIWLVDGERDLPPWLTAENPHIRTIGVPAPDFDVRLQAARLLAARFGVLEPEQQPQTAEIVQAFAAQSDGLSLSAMQEITLLAKDRQVGFLQLPEAIRAYKLGVVEDPWRRRYLRDRIRDGQPRLHDRVKGQVPAVVKTLDILKRAALGLSGAQARSSDSRPRGVLFFAGPTGVGKTELAKAVASLVFGDKGDESAFLRFDMSEFSAEHSADRLIGAPPGYVGFEAGGELTNAVRQNPFRVILFDEIEKAHGHILDKFLQILEDGRLTDGQGNTTYFTECVIIFTSNLGVQEEDPETKRRTTLVTPDTPYDEVQDQVEAGIRSHFVNKLGRPELLNRLGGNIVVFDFIRPDVAAAIFGSQLANILKAVADKHGVTITVDPEVRQRMCDLCTRDVANGGRGIGNQLEQLFINPLARALFDRELTPGLRLTVRGFDPDELTLELR